MERPLTSRLNERFGGSPLSTEFDPATIAANFGVSYPAAKSLPESELAIRHVEDDVESSLLLDVKKTPQQKPQPQSLLKIVTSRLQSIKPRTQARADQVREMVAELQEPLAAADELVTVLEMERFEELETRFQELQELGRELRERIGGELQGEVYTAMQDLNASEAVKVKCVTRLETLQAEKRVLHRDRFASDKDLKAADAKVKMAADAVIKARDAALEGQRAFAIAENNLKLAQSEVRGIGIAMDRCQAEIAGAAYHDPTLGLSVQPQESW
jgi:hypothetical protein